ncbi:MAG: CorA family divalent cation transporter [Verrucomicrobiota bacterium]
MVLDSGEVLHELAVRKSSRVPETTQPYLQSIAGAVERIGDDLAVHRDTLNDAVNLYLNAVSHHTNRIVKRLTIVGTIFMPLTFLCGVYGMNMPIPEAGWKGMYAVFWGLCALFYLASIWMMRKWKWL